MVSNIRPRVSFIHRAFTSSLLSLFFSLHLPPSLFAFRSVRPSSSAFRPRLREADRRRRPDGPLFLHACFSVSRVPALKWPFLACGVVFTRLEILSLPFDIVSDCSGVVNTGAYSLNVIEEILRHQSRTALVFLSTNTELVSIDSFHAHIVRWLTFFLPHRVEVRKEVDIEFESLYPCGTMRYLCSFHRPRPMAGQSDCASVHPPSFTSYPTVQSSNSFPVNLYSPTVSYPPGHPGN